MVVATRTTKKYTFPDHAMIAVAGRRRSGKTFLVCDWLKTKLRGKFHHIYIISGTAAQQSVFDSFRNQSGVTFLATIDNTRLTSILETNKNNKQKILLLYDDCAASRNTAGKRFKNDEMLDKLAVMGRHYNATVIVLTQRLTLLSTTVRSQLDALVLFRTNIKQGELAFDEHASIEIEKFEDFWRLLKYCTKEPHSTLLIDANEHKFYKNDSLVRMENK